MGVDRTGNLSVLGIYLCEGKADEAFWLKVLSHLRSIRGIGSLGLLIHDGENAIINPMARIFPNDELLDIAGYADEAAYRRARYNALSTVTDQPESVLAELEAFESEMLELLAQEYETTEAVQTVLDPIRSSVCF